MLRRLKLSQVKISHELLVNGISDSSVVWNRHLSTPTSWPGGKLFDKSFNAIKESFEYNFLSTFGCV